jgi:hypothetical protein
MLFDVTAILINAWLFAVAALDFKTVCSLVDEVSKAPLLEEHDCKCSNTIIS